MRVARISDDVTRGRDRQHPAVLTVRFRRLPVDADAVLLIDTGDVTLVQRSDAAHHLAPGADAAVRSQRPRSACCWPEKSLKLNTIPSNYTHVF